MDTLRWILLIAGIAVIAGLFGYYKWQEYQVTRPRRRRGRSAPREAGRNVDDALRDLDDFVVDDPEDDVEPEPLPLDPEADAVGEPRPVRDQEPRRPPPEEPPPAPRQRDAFDEPAGDPAAEEEADDGWTVGPVRIRRPSISRFTGRGDDTAREAPARRQADEPADLETAQAQVGEKIVVLHVAAGEGMVFAGPAVIEALESVGMRHGLHEIYHVTGEGPGGETPMFSAASMVKPGTLNPDQAQELDTPGVALFMQLPGPFDGLACFERMLETARRLADRLDGHLLDGQRCELTSQAVEHIREDLREYRRLAHLAARRTSRA